MYSCRMTINKIPLPPVGADLSCTPPIYRPALAYVIPLPPVGADLSCTPPIYRPALAFPLSQFKTEKGSHFE